MSPENCTQSAQLLNVDQKIMSIKGYGPRLIRPMLDGRRFMIACKDGSLEFLDIKPHEITKETKLKLFNFEDPKTNNPESDLIKHLHFQVCDPVGSTDGPDARLKNRITAFSEWDHNSILAGTKRGQLVLLDINKAEAGFTNRVCPMETLEDIGLQEIEEELAPLSNRGRVLFIGWLGPNYQLISFTDIGFILYRSPKGRTGAIKIPILPRSDLGNIICAVRLTHPDPTLAEYKNVLFIKRNGQALLANDPPKTIEGWHFKDIGNDLWNPGEKPGFIEDFALIKPFNKPKDPMQFRLNILPCHGVFVATDRGVFKINPLPELQDFKGENKPTWSSDGFFLKENDPKSQVWIRKALQIFLPDLSAGVMAITHFATQKGQAKDRDYLWVSGVDGDMNLYTSDHPAQVSFSWQQIRVMHDAAQTPRCYASWLQTKGNGFIVIQARRDERIVVSHYFKPEETIGDEGEEGDLPQCIFHYIATGKGFEKIGKDILGENTEEVVHKIATFLQYIADNNTTTGVNFLELLLSIPGKEIAQTAFNSVYIETRKNTDDPDEIGEIMSEALCFWVYTFMGLIHARFSEHPEDFFIRLIRWLRMVEEQLLKKPNKDLVGQWPQGVSDFHSADQDRHNHAFHWAFDPALARTVEQMIFFVRKWGIHAKNQRERLGLQRFEALLDKNKEKGRLPDRMTATGLLFSRYFDEDHLPKRWRVEPNQMPSPVIAVHSVGDQRDDVLVVRTSRKSQEHQKNMLWFHIEKDKNNGNSLLTTAVKRTVDKQEWVVFMALQNEELTTLYRGVTEDEWKKATLKYEKPNSLNSEDYSSLKLVGNESLGWWLAAGCLGRDGSAKCDLYKVFWQKHEVCRIEGPKTMPLPSLTPELGAGTETGLVGSNRIQTMASLFVPKCLNRPSKAANRYKYDRFILVMGCEDGQVWQIEKFSNDNLEDVGEDGWSLSPRKLAELGNPVTAMGLSLFAQNTPRVFAGTENGTIIALGFNPEQQSDGPFKTPTALWATVEKRGIVRLQTYGKGDQGLLMAACRDGRIVLYNNQSGTSDVREDKHERIKAMGCRRARAKLRRYMKQAVTYLIDPEEPDQRQLLYLDEHNQLGEVVMKYPQHSEKRKKAFQTRLADLEEHLPAKDHNKRHRHMYRILEAIESSSQTPLIVLLRMIMFDPQKDGSIIDRITKENAGWLPLRLQQLYHFMKAFNECQFQDEQTCEQHFMEVLRPLTNRHNLELYKEVAEGILKRCNVQLFAFGKAHWQHEGKNEKQTDDSQQIKSFMTCYAGILEAIHKSNLNHETIKSRMQVQMHTVRHMMDGDALWAAAVLSQKPDDMSKTPLNVRIKQVYRFLVQGDMILALETLRACNFSLWRAAQRMRTMNMKSLPWCSLHNFFRTVGDFTARGTAADNRTGVALNHEIVRSFALGVVVCPEASMLWANIMWESKMPGKSFREVLAQIKFLRIVGDLILDDDREHRKECLELFSFASRWELRDEDGEKVHHPDGLKNRLISKLKGWDKELLDTQQKPNTDIMQQLNPFFQVTNYLIELTEQLETHARGIDLQSFSKNHEILKSNVKEHDYFKHSREFWVTCLSEIATKLKGVLASKDNIRPEAVLHSHTIADWAQKTLKSLEDYWTKKKIFDPEHFIWKRVLQQLCDAARRFPKSTAVHQNILLASFGHGLLESLDEHLFEMEEVAQILDPVGVWLPDDLERKSSGHIDVTQKLAKYLMSRSRYAESIPKNLRTLQNLFQQGKDNLASTMGKLVSPFSNTEDKVYGWFLENKDASYKINEKHSPFFQLALGELASNDRVHGRRDSTEARSGDQLPRVVVIKSQDKSRVTQFKIIFPLIYQIERNSKDQESQKELQMRRWKMIFGDGNAACFQEPASANPDRSIPSHGLGLYLANLAMGMINWKMSAKLDPGDLSVSIEFCEGEAFVN